MSIASERFILEQQGNILVRVGFKGMKDIQDKMFLQRLQEQTDVEKIILFGSRARGDQDARSDIDLCLVGTFSSAKWLELLQIVEEADTLLEIDLVCWAESSEELQQRIQQEGVCLFEREQGENQFAESKQSACSVKRSDRGKGHTLFDDRWNDSAL